MIEKISTKNMSREEWLAHRRNGIGGSDAAAVVGMSEYTSPYMLWCDKTGRSKETEETWIIVKKVDKKTKNQEKNNSA